MPRDGTTLRNQLTDRNLNPVRSVATFNPEDVYDALVTKYGAGKVTTDRDTTSMGQYQYRIAP
jgi:hypothetical protein